MSPGSLPICGILGRKIKITPIMTVIRPINIRNFPI